MKRQIKTVASGSTGLADALGAAMARKLHIAPSSTPLRRPYSEANKQDRKLVASGSTNKTLSPAALNPLLERRRREENNNRILKHSAVIKRQDPRLLQELLQEFGSTEGLSAPKQEELIKRLRKIRDDYRI